MTQESNERALDAMAQRVSSIDRKIDGLLKTRQVVRSSVLTPGGDVQMSDLLSDARDVVTDFPDAVETIGNLDDAQSGDLDAIGAAVEGAEEAADQVFEARMRLAAAELERQAAEAELNARLSENERVLGEADGRLAVTEERLSQVEPRVTEALEGAAAAQVEAVLAKGLLTVAGTTPTAADGEGKPLGAVWMHRDGAAVATLYEWTTFGWSLRPLSEQIIPQVSIGTGTYGELSGTRLTAKSVGANEIAAQAIVTLSAEITEAFIRTGHIVSLDVSKLAVTGSAAMAEAVIDKIWSDVVKAKFLTVTEKIITQDVIATGAIDGMTIRGNEIIGATVSGSFYDLLGYTSNPTWSLTDAMNSLTGWTAANGTRTLDTSSPHSPAASIRLTPSSTTLAATLERSFTLPDDLALNGTIWIWSPTVTTIGYRFHRALQQVTAWVDQDVPANTWTQISISVGKTNDSSRRPWDRVVFRVAAGTAAFVKFDDFALSSVTVDARRLMISRDSGGSPRLDITYNGKQKVILSGQGPEDSPVMQLWSADTTQVASIFPGQFSVHKADAQGKPISASVMLNTDGLSFAESPLGGTEIKSAGMTGMTVAATGLGSIAHLTLRSVGGDVRIQSAGGKIQMYSPVQFQGDTDWANATLPASVTGTARWRRYLGVIYVQYNITNSTAIGENGLLSPAFTLPSAALPEVNAGLNVVGAGTWPAIAWVSAATGACTIRNLRTGSTGVSSFYGSGQWPAPGL